MKRRFILVLTMLLAITLALLLSGCSAGEDDLEGKNIVTFEINGGLLNYGTSSTKTKINFAYHPGTFIVNPLELPNYTISRNGYVFTGWYKSAECNESEKWDFEATPFNDSTLTLYAGWKKAINYTYTLVYTDEKSEEVTLGTYTVDAGDTFSDKRKFANNRKDYTCVGYFSDKECEIPWNYETTHPGGEVDLDITVYVDYIEGNWVLVDSYEKLKSAIKGSNVYLTADIDCGGGELYNRDSYNKIFRGNDFTVSNFTVESFGTKINPTCAIFNTLGEDAVIEDVNFENVTYNFLGISNSTENVQVTPRAAALAINMTEGAKVSNVSVKGTLNTNYRGELASLELPFVYDEGENPPALAGVTDFEAEITLNVNN